MTPNILLIEDNPDITNVVKYDLEQAGYQVMTAEDGASGLTSARENKPDLVILDLGLPDFSGEEVARRLRATSNVPVIILTAMDAVEQKVSLLRAGANDYIVKPFYPEELLARVEVQLRAQPGSGEDTVPEPSVSRELSFPNPLPVHLQSSDQPHWLSLLAAALTHTTSGISITANTDEHPVVYCNPAFERLTGYTSSEIVGQSWRVLQGEHTDPDALAGIYEAIEAGKPTDLVLLNYRKDGSSFWSALNIGPIRNEENAVTHFIGVHTDVTDRVNTQRELEHRAYTDILTGLANRTQFMMELKQEAAQPESQGLFALAFIDLDGFKAINDCFGHEAGDELLRQVAQRLRGVVRNVDLAARLAGDEFVLLLRHVDSDAALELIAQRTLAAFQPAFELEAFSVTVHASVGLVRHRPGESAVQMLSRADQAMYQTKRQGKNDFTLDLTTLG